ncbi:F-box/FBD/LRR-repeat protein At3g14710-like [Trifolium pratense]|uniref:F-box/FBD/LRR-repeat protein At3g14710-like n=1 Tax=Trifolium pratense TaxID=57577 RepID=UPI001E69360A|nr:F-box/FBD/LRR-repeat protein At3g14710-like [Trifolium pratense]
MHSGSVTACTSAGRHDNEPSERQKFSEDEDGDRISNLPDFIIGHILTFLHTKNAIQTSLLSSRWRYMWTFITKLSFKDNELPVSFPREKIKTWFVNYVSRVFLHLNSASIEEFSLEIDEKYDSYLINQWISAVSNKRVKRIHVWSIKACDLFFCPLFKCQSLEELVLDIIGGCSIKIPTFVSLSSLTVLDLVGITFTCYSSITSKELTLNFPVLRAYKTRRCTWLDVKSLTLEAPILEEVSLSYNESHAEIKFCTSHLKEFHYNNDRSAETVVLDAHIASTKIRLSDFWDINVQESWIFVCKLLTVNAKCSKLCLELNWWYLAGQEHYLAGIPEFELLRDLELHYVTGEVLLRLLLKSPYLETLVCNRILDSYEEEPVNFATVPDCFLSTLKEVTFENITDNECELSFAKFVMENAQVLERISFSCSRKPHVLENFQKKLASVNCSSNIAIEEYYSCYLGSYL